jgi:phage tail sheath protein FI
VFAQKGPHTWRRVRGQVEAFLEALDQEGAFPGEVSQERYFVFCDERINAPGADAESRLSLLVGFAASRPGEFHAFVVTQRASGSAVRSVSVNRMATSGARVSEEIETAILRGLTAP